MPLFKLISVTRRIPSRQVSNNCSCNHKISQYVICYFEPITDSLYIGASTCEIHCIAKKSLVALGANPFMQNVTALACEYLECYDARDYFGDEDDGISNF